MPRQAARLRGVGRRNLSKLDRIALVRLLEPIERERADQRMKSGKASDPQAKLPEGQSRDHLAKLAGVSGKTYEAGVRVLEKGTPALQQAVRENVCSVSAAATLSKAWLTSR